MKLLDENILLDELIQYKCFCCGCLPTPLYFIPVKITKICGAEYGMVNSHYSNHAWECPKCGDVFEIRTGRDSQEFIGDFMCDNYTHHFNRPYLEHINIEFNKKHEKRIDKLELAIYHLEKRCESRISKIKDELGELTNGQREKLFDKNIDKKALTRIEAEIKSINKLRIKEVREHLNISNPQMQNNLYNLQIKYKSINAKLLDNSIIDTEKLDLIKEKSVVLSEITKLELRIPDTKPAEGIK
jgi:hypothetical protein